MCKQKFFTTGIALIFMATLLGVGGEAQENGAFFAGGGPSITALFLDLRGLNAHLPGTGFMGDFKLGESAAFLMNGGGGFIGDRLRIGGVGAERSWTAPINDLDFDRAELFFRYGGFLLELMWPRGRAGISIGGVFGSGRISLKLSKASLGRFEEVIKQPNSLELSREFFIMQPYLSIEFKLVDFMGLKIEAGFLFGLGRDDWKLIDGTKVPGGPLSTISAPTLGVMLVFGG